MAVSPPLAQAGIELCERVARAFREAQATQALTQAELARRVGVTPSNVSRWLRAEQVPGGAALRKLPYVLKVSPDWLVANRGPMHPDGRTPPAARPDAEFIAGGWQALADVAAALARVREAWAAREGTTRGAGADGRAADLAAAASPVSPRPRRKQG